MDLQVRGSGGGPGSDSSGNSSDPSACPHCWSPQPLPFWLYSIQSQALSQLFPCPDPAASWRLPALARSENGAEKGHPRTGKLLLKRIASTLSAEASPHWFHRLSPGKLKDLLAVAVLLPAALGKLLRLLILLNSLQWPVLWQLLLQLIGLNLNIGFFLLTPG